MAKIYKTTDRIEVKIDDIIVKIAPFTMLQKNEVNKMLIEGQKNLDVQKLNDAILLAMKYCLKDIKGIKDSDDNEYTLEFDSGMVTDACLNDLMNLEQSEQLQGACASFLGGVPKAFKIEGVSFVNEGKK